MILARFRYLPFVAAALVVLPRGGDLRSPEPVVIRAAEAQDAQDPPLPEDLRIKVDVAARNAVRWLLHEQQLDGSWRSPNYAVLRGGQAYTPFVLHTLLTVPGRIREVPKEAVDNAVTFIRSQADPDGALGYHDSDILEYPVYATSYAVRALKLAAPDDPLIAKMAAWLAGMQLVEKKGFETKSPAYGGWGFGVRTLPAGDPGHMDLAHTRRALEALNDAGALTDEIKSRAARFVGLMQKDDFQIGRFPGVPGYEQATGKIPFDGGFFFSPIVLGANKALWEVPGADRRSYFRSYSTATADGALALIALGARPDRRAAADGGPETLARSKSLQAAASWLKNHWQVDPAGIPRDHPEPWVAALRFYQLAVMAEVAPALKLPPSRMVPFAKRIVELQADDGSFANLESGLMKEDDPILATTLALIALERIAPEKLPESRKAPVTKRPETRPEPQTFRQDVAWSPDGRLLAFSEHVREGAGKPGTWAVWIVAADGTGRRKLADGGCFVTWSADGSELAYAVLEKNGDERIHVIRADGSDPVAITGPHHVRTIRDTHPAWSPKGDLIAFSSNREGGSHIFVMATNGTAITQLTKDLARDYNPSWSPDGQRIAFCRDHGDGKCRIVTIGVDGKDEQVVVKDDANDVYPGFLRSGRIGFGAEKESKPAIFTVAADGTGAARVGAMDAWFARWSPDGSRVAYISGRFPESRIYVMNSDGSEARPLEN